MPPFLPDFVICRRRRRSPALQSVTPRSSQARARRRASRASPMTAWPIWTAEMEEESSKAAEENARRRPSRRWRGGDDEVAGPDRLGHEGAGDEPHGAHEDERVEAVGLVEPHAAGRGGDAHAVAVVAHAGHHRGHRALGGQGPGGQGAVVGGGGEAEDVRVQHGLGAQARAQDVADHAADAGLGAAVGLHRAGVVVGLGLVASAQVLSKARCRRCPRTRTGTRL